MSFPLKGDCSLGGSFTFLAITAPLLCFKEKTTAPICSVLKFTNSTDVNISPRKYNFVDFLLNIYRYRYIERAKE